MTARTFHVLAPGKLMLCGEYAVLHGAPALCAAVNRHARAQVEPDDDGLWLTALGMGPFKVAARTGSVTFTPAPEAPGKLLLVEHVLRRVGAGARGKVTLDSQALSADTLDASSNPVKLGLGSSAAASVALTAALEVMVGGASSADARRWFEHAQRAHLAAQGGLGSGVDVATSATGGVISYQRPDADPSHAIIRPVAFAACNLHLVVAFAGKSASTVALLQKMMALEKSRPALAQSRYEVMGRVAKDAVGAVDAGNAAGVLAAMDEYGAQMEALGGDAGADIVSAPHARIRQLARGVGGAAKPSGAGGGDVAVCFCPSAEAATDLQAQLAQEQLTVIPLALDPLGARVVLES